MHPDLTNEFILNIDELYTSRETPIEPDQTSTAEKTMLLMAQSIVALSGTIKHLHEEVDSLRQQLDYISDQNRKQQIKQMFNTKEIINVYNE